MQPLIFASSVLSGEDEQPVCLLAESLRRFGKEYNQAQIWVCVPESGQMLTAHTRSALRTLDVSLVPYACSEDELAFPFAAKTIAAGAAEKRALGQPDAGLVWLDSGSLFFNAPVGLQLAPEKQFACRAVDFKLIGSPANEEPDVFWRLIYEYCGVAAEQIFAVSTWVDRQQIRAYLNAGMLVTRPQNGLFQRWCTNFRSIYRQDDFDALYRQNQLYAVFIHQAVLSATLLASLRPDQFQWLPDNVNYPLHLHDRVVAERQPARLNDLVSCRYEQFFEDEHWEEKIRVEEPLRSWLRESV